MNKRRYLYLYSVITLITYVFMYVYYMAALNRGGMADLGAILTIIYLIIPIYSLISGILQRIFNVNIYVFLLINFIANNILIYSISDVAANSYIISLIYSLISILVSYIAKIVLTFIKKKKKL